MTVTVWPCSISRRAAASSGVTFPPSTPRTDTRVPLANALEMPRSAGPVAATEVP